MRKILLLTFALMCILCTQTNAYAADVNSVKATIVKHALELGVDPAIALSIARAESGFRHEARSKHGAVGVFQLMPSTARRMGLNPYSLNDNIRGGIMYYKKMYNMFGSVELALAAYNAGPGNVKKYHAVPPYGETKRFVSKIMTDVNKQKHNPDPAVLKAGRSYQAAGKPMPKVLSQSLAKVPAAKLQDTSDLHAEILDEKQIELHLETRPVAI